MSWAEVARAPRKKDPQYKRQHKAARLRELLLERKREAKYAVGLERSLGRSIRRTEAAFKDCTPERLAP
jgi:hypothetical protein